MSLQLLKPIFLERDFSPKLIAHLWLAAKNAQKKAYAPYSNFLVGAGILDEQGNIFSGVNVENAAYPLGTCAEAGAISQMVLNGSLNIRAILIVGSASKTKDKNGEIIVPCTPCGGCRQKIREFASLQTPILMADSEEIFGYVTLENLLPLSFGPEHIKD